MRKQLKALLELISIAASTFALLRELNTGLEKADPSPEQQAILAKLKGPSAKLKAEFKEAVKDLFGIIARTGR
jgi:hypothetical protein